MTSSLGAAVLGSPECFLRMLRQTRMNDHRLEMFGCPLIRTFRGPRSLRNSTANVYS